MTKHEQLPNFASNISVEHAKMQSSESQPSAKQENFNAKKLRQKQHWNNIWRSGFCGGLLSLLLPALILFLAYQLENVFPTGDQHILTVDLYHQYAPFLRELRDKLLHFDSLWFTWSGGMGLNFFAVICYYALSPLNLLLLIFPQSYLTETVLLITLAKVALAGGSMYLCLRRIIRLQPFETTAFAVAYALSGYALAYSWNIMWLDTLYVLPFVVWALARLITSGRWLWFTASIAYLLITNYYMGFFACFFLAIYYFPLRSRLEARTKLKPLYSFLQTVGAGLLGVGISLVVLIPVVKYLSLTSAAGDSFPAEITFKYPWLQLLVRLMPLTVPASRDGMPNIYVGLVILLLLPLYFFNRQLSLKIRLWHALALAFVVLSFNLNVLDFIWHGMHFPNQLPFRYAFVCCFLLVMMAADGKRNSKQIQDTRYWVVVASLVLAVLVIQLVNPDLISGFAIFASAIFLCLYLTLFKLEQFSAFDRKFAIIAVAVLMLVETTFNAINGIAEVDANEYFGSRDGYLRGSIPKTIEKMVSDYDLRSPNNRAEKLADRTVNDPMLYNLNGLTIFSSTYPAKPVKFFNNLGFPSNGINSYQYDSSNILLDSLFGIRYLMRTTDVRTWPKDPVRTLITEEEQVQLYQNTEALPLLYWVPKQAHDLQINEASYYYENQNKLATSLGASENIWQQFDWDIAATQSVTAEKQANRIGSFDVTPAGTTAQRLSLQANNLQPGKYFINYKFSGAERSEIHLKVNQDSYTVPNREHGMVEVGEIKVGDKVNFDVDFKDQVTDASVVSVELCRLNESSYKALINKLKQHSAEPNFIASNKLKTTLEAPAAGYVLFTTTADPGWQIKVNDQPVAYEKLSDALILIPVEQGANQIEAYFLPEGLKLGAILSLIALIITLVCAKLTWRRQIWRSDQKKIKAKYWRHTVVKPALVSSMTNTEVVDSE